MERQFLSYGKTKIIKVKFQQKSDNDTNFLTQYLITLGLIHFQ